VKINKAISLIQFLTDFILRAHLIFLPFIHVIDSRDDKEGQHTIVEDKMRGIDHEEC